MITSMTGFASLTHEDPRATIAVTARAVNHRFLDLQVRLPSSLPALEARVRGLVQGRVARGRVEVTVAVHMRDPSVPEVALNEPFVAALTAAMDRARERGLIQGILAPGDLLRLPHALTIRERAVEADAEVEEGVIEAVDRTVAELARMRQREGDHLRADMDARLATLETIMAALASAADDGRVAIEARLHDRVRELAVVSPVDEAMIAQEIVRTAARSDIAEEVTRFAAHVAQWRALTAGSEPCGRTLDFLLQEMNREVNTAGSKADGLRVPELIVTAKAELERMREQVQNVE